MSEGTRQTAYHRRFLLWNNESGETMIETLVSILISSLALLMLSTAIGASVNMVLMSKENMESYYTEESLQIEKAAKPELDPDLENQDVSIEDSSDNATALRRDGDNNLVYEKVDVYKYDTDVILYERSSDESGS